MSPEFLRISTGRQKLILLSAFILLLASGTDELAAQRPVQSGMHELIREGIIFSGKQEYGRAKSAFKKLILEYPSHPAGYMNMAILLEVISLDFETPTPQPEYDRLLDKVLELSERMLEKQDRSVESHYYLGMANSYIAYSKFRNGKNWLSGLTHGLKAIDHLDDCLSIDRNAFDAMTGIGTYKYWKSARMSFLSWTPLIDDERRLGIRMLKIAEQKARYTSAQATNSLIWIYIEEERYDDAIRSAKKILKRYPGNRLFLWGLASAAEGKEDWKTAIEAYQQILKSVDGSVSESRYILIQARARIARLSFQIGDRSTALRECTWVLKQENIELSHFTDDGADRIQRRIEDMYSLKEELE